jgi:hypothetical protein
LIATDRTTVLKEQDARRKSLPVEQLGRPRLLLRAEARRKALID